MKKEEMNPEGNILEELEEAKVVWCEEKEESITFSQDCGQVLSIVCC